jgi:hypothetical protein
MGLESLARRPLIAGILSLVLCPAAAYTRGAESTVELPPDDLARQILEDSALRGGFIVHLGSGHPGAIHPRPLEGLVRKSLLVLFFSLR